MSEKRPEERDMRKNILQFFYAVDGSKSNQASALGIKPGSPPTLPTPDLLTPPVLKPWVRRLLAVAVLS